MKYRGIGLRRLSTEEQAADGRAGLLRQHEEIRLAARKHDVDLVRIIDIVDVSGTQVSETPEFQQLVLELREPGIHGLVVAAIDRLVRPDDFTAFSIFQIFLKNRKLIWTPSGEIDVAEDAGFMQAMMQGLMAGLDRRKILRNTQLAKEENRKRGRCANATITLPQGVDFDFKTGRWSWVEPEAGRLKEAFALLLSRTMTVRAIARRLGYPCERTLYNKLRNPIWIGIREYRHKRGEKYPTRNGRQSDRRKVLRDEPLRVPIEIEPLISVVEFEHAQEILAGVRHQWNKSRQAESRFESSGLIYCICGEPFYSKGDRRRGKHDFYYCRSQHRGGRGCGATKPKREQLDHTLTAFVAETFTKPKTLRTLIDSASQAAGTERIKAEIGAAGRELDRLRIEKQRLLSQSVKGFFSESEIEREARRIEIEKQAISSRLRGAEQTLAASALDGRAVAAAIASVFGEFEFLSLSDRKRILGRYVSKIQVSKGQISQVTIKLPAAVAINRIRTGTGS